MQSFLEWGKYTIVLVYIWLAVAYWVGAKRSREPRWWASGLPWLTYIFLLWQQYHYNLGEFDAVPFWLMSFLICCPMFLIGLHLIGKVRMPGYTYAYDLLLFRHPTTRPSPRRVHLYESLGIALLTLGCASVTFLSLSLRPCHWLDRTLAVSGCQKVLPLPSLLQDLTFSPDGQRIAATTYALSVWHSTTGAQLATLPDTAEVETVAFAPNNQLFAVGGHQPVIELRSVTTNTVEQSFPVTNTVASLAFSPDGQLLAAGTYGGVLIWHIADGTLLHTLPAQEIYSVVFAPNGQLLASGGIGGDITLWSVPTFSKVHTLSSSTVYQLAFSPDNRLLAAAEFGDQVTMWQLSDYGHVWSFRGTDTQERMSSVTYSPNSEYLIGGSSTGEVRIWRVADSTLQTTLRFNDQVRKVTLSPSGETLAIGLWDDTVRLWRWPVRR